MSWEMYLNRKLPPVAPPPIEPLWTRQACRARVTMALHDVMNATKRGENPMPVYTAFWKKAWGTLAQYAEKDMERAVATGDLLSREWESILDENFTHLKPTLRRLIDEEIGAKSNTLVLSF